MTENRAGEMTGPEGEGTGGAEQGWGGWEGGGEGTEPDQESRAGSGPTVSSQTPIPPPASGPASRPHNNCSLNPSQLKLNCPGTGQRAK